MKTYLLLALAFVSILASASPARAGQQIWYVTSPDHGQTYAFGSEQDQSWSLRGNHLALNANFNNQPYAQGGNTRTDSFVFNFPQIKLGSGGHTFFYHADGLNLPVARLKSGFLGITQIDLLPTAFLRIKKVHGYLTMILVVGVAPFQENPDTQIGFLH